MDCHTRLIVSFVVVAIILISTLFAESVFNIAQDEIGANYGQTTRHFRGDISGPGRVLWQPDSRLITFKNTFMPWDYAVDCWTKDGLEAVLYVSVQTRYVTEEIFDILYEFGEENEFTPFIAEIISELVRDECSKFTSFNYYDSRGAIQSNMTFRIDSDLPRLGTHIRTGGFLQLKNVQMPNEFNAAITNKRVAEQDIAVRTNQREQQIIVANTNLSQARTEGTIIVNHATQTAQGILYAAEQQAQATRTAFEQRLVVYRMGAMLLNMTPDDYVNKLLAVGLLERGAASIYV